MKVCKVCGDTHSNECKPYKEYGDADYYFEWPHIVENTRTAINETCPDCWYWYREGIGSGEKPAIHLPHWP